MHSPRTGRRGQAMVFILMMSTVMFILAGLAVDFVWAYVIRARLVTSVDAAALAAVRALGRGDANISRVVTLVFESNFPPEYMLAKAVDFTPPVISSPEPGIRNVTLHGSATAPTFFMRILGFESIDVSALATASRRDVNLMLVLDRSGSLHETRANAWVSVQEAASFFVDQFDDSRDQVGLVSFGSGANVDVPLGTGFKTPVLNAINAQIVAFGAGTNSPHGMWLAYAELLRLQDANPLNVIVFFTDGQPSAYTGVFNVRTTPNPSNNSVPYCDTSPKEAVIGTLQSTTTAAFYDILGFWNPHAAGPPVTVRYQSGQDYDYFIVDGCNSPNGSFLHNGSAVELLFDAGTCLPMTWTPTWAGVTRTFSMVTGPYSVDQCSSLLKATASSSQFFRGDQVHNAAKNLTVNIAEAARQDSSLGQVRVYSVGLGGWGYPADGAFLQIVANDPQSTQFSTSEPSGIYVYAPSQLQLRAAFNTVASEIFRLIR